MPALPLKADHVGSLLRPVRLTDARDAWRDGTLPDDDLRPIEDECIRDLVAQQEAAGIQAVTDGEFRRDWWHLDFLDGFDGIELQDRPRPASFKGAEKSPPIAVAVGKVRHTEPIFVDAFTFLNDTTSATAKITIPGPGVAHFLGGRATVSEDAYPDLDDFWADLVTAYRAEVAALYAAGCRYLQFDDVSFAYLCDPDFRAKMVERGDDPDHLVATYRDAINAVIADRPDDLLVTTHMCRGNFKSHWVASGGYEPVAELLLGDLDIDAFFMEFDSDRSGGFEPLRHLAPGKTAVLGLVTSKSGELESDDDIVRRLEEAAQVVPLEQLALSPQCGFSSTHHGNDITPEQQWAKLELCVRVADRVWG